MAAASVTASLVLAAPASARIVDAPITYSADDATLALAPIGTYETGVFDESAAEIVAFHGTRLYVVNAQAGVVDVLDASNPAAPTKLFSIAGTGVANSINVRADGLGVVAFESTTKTEPGTLLFFDADAPEATVLGSVVVGALPDNVEFSKDGAYAISANEGEPNDEFTVDPEGSVSVVTLPATKAAPAQSDVRTADFHEFEVGGSKTLDPAVRVFGPTPHGDDLPVSRNLEPEYVAVDGGTAYAALQEANAVAVIDLASATVTDIWPLGFKDLSVAGNGIDPSDRDPQGASTFSVRTFENLFGIYNPDGIVAYQAGDQTFLVTANEGDVREWGDYVEATRAKDIEDFGPVSPQIAALLGDGDLGRLNVSIEDGFNEETGQYEALYTYGGRSFSIWTTDGTQVFDSGDQFENITYAANPAFFNSNHSEANFEGRSDDKGPEPENLAIGAVGGRTYAFIGLERVGGVMVYDITDPAGADFVTYVNNRDFAADPETPDAGDLGPEGLEFISGAASPTGLPLLAVGNEVSGTTTLFSLTDLTPDTTSPVVALGDTGGSVFEGNAVTLTVAASDDRALTNVVGTITRDGKVVKKTQLKVDGAARATHTIDLSSVVKGGLPVGDYVLTFSAKDAARNQSEPQEFAFSIVDTTRPEAVLVTPTATAVKKLKIQVDATDAQGLQRVVANVYKDGKLVTSTQKDAKGKTTATHKATVELADGTYQIKYNAQDVAGNISKTGTYSVTVDAKKPTITVKDGATYTKEARRGYELVSFKLYDAGKIARLTLNGVEKDLTDNTWSDLNFVKPGQFGAVEGTNVLVVYDVAGNAQRLSFRLAG
ncbi:hypothetical protein GCM10009775_15550 [Microbacterium aoyamense]|uniref:Alkaline phosphatase n=1 Tax=Microbacterium aoyamense TaxID=344166 RepID=A0ABP5AW35_9MICO